MVRERVERCREIQKTRFDGEGIYTNSQMNNAMIKKFCSIDATSENLLETVFRTQHLSPRSATRILKVARTIADLDGRNTIGQNDVAEAIQYKTIDKKELLV